MAKYEITTINDIIENIPTDRIEIFMHELKEMILHAKLSVDVARALDPNARPELKTPLIWDDDGKHEIKVSHHVNNKHIMTTKETLSA